MAKTISNVLVGVATLSIREPNDAIAEWATAQVRAGAHSAKLYKGGSGNDGSTHVQITPPAGLTLAAFTLAIINNNFWHHCSAVLGNWVQMEFRFEDPNSQGWVELTAVPLQTYLGTGAWVQTTLANNTPSGYGGVGEAGASFFNWVLADLNLQEAAINAEGAVGSASDWVLTRVRLELWEATPERTCYIDGVTINGVAYTIEPGGTAPAIELDSPATEVGYTEDGVTLEYNAEEADIDVEEETFSINRVITKETLAVICNMAESSLYNIDKAMAGSVLSGNILTLGDGANKTVNLKIEGTNPAGFTRAVYIPIATAMGTVGMAYKKGTKTVVPVRFQALKGSSPACTIVDNVV